MGEGVLIFWPRTVNWSSEPLSGLPEPEWTGDQLETCFPHRQPEDAWDQPRAAHGGRAATAQGEEEPSDLSSLEGPSQSAPSVHTEHFPCKCWRLRVLDLQPWKRRHRLVQRLTAKGSRVRSPRARSPPQSSELPVLGTRVFAPCAGQTGGGGSGGKPVALLSLLIRPTPRGPFSRPTSFPSCQPPVRPQPWQALWLKLLSSLNIRIIHPHFAFPSAPPQRAPRPGPRTRRHAGGPERGWGRRPLVALPGGGGGARESRRGSTSPR